MSTDFCAGCSVRQHALCSSLSPEGRADLAGLCQRRRVAAGETVMWAGDASLICANLLSGVLKMVAATADGREQIVGLFYPADFVGQPYVAELPFTVTALTDAELCTVARRPFERFLENHAPMENLLLKRTFGALNEARGRMLTLARLSAGEKVAGLLLDMATRTGLDGPPADPNRVCGSDPRAARDLTEAFDLPMTRGHMADVLGMTIETVSRQLTKLRNAGIIALSGVKTVTIVDAAALRDRAAIA